VKPRLLFLLAACALVLASCNRVVVPTTPGTTTTASTTTAAPTTTETTLPGGTEGLPPELRAEIARLIGVTEKLRGLEFAEPPLITVLTQEELAQRVRDQVAESEEDLLIDEKMYRLLGLIEPERDLLETVRELYGSAVAGFYDGETGELVVTSQEDKFTPFEQVTLVHELTHSLTDQLFDFHGPYQQLIDDDRLDEASATQALIEGDASLTQILFIQQMTLAEQRDFLAEALAADTSYLEGVPRFIQDSIMFPYSHGLSFAQSLYERGGLDTINSAYQSPPLSTEQIFDPGKYNNDPPRAVTLPPGELTGYEVAYTSTWGELGFRLVFDQVLGGRDQAAQGWGGDSYRLFVRDDDVVLMLIYQGDTEQDAVELQQALDEYVAAAIDVGAGAADGAGTRYQGNHYAYVGRVGDRVAWIVASDSGDGATVREWLAGF
jgi:hypothetical protein